ncbi:MAG: competence/damage-inducible protein A [Nitrospirae bacterium]|nr:competence/damage-inducible protein A [Nitrospirota bacterium]
MDNSQSAEKTAGIILIGNEILSGKVRDYNSSYLASELWSLGVSLMRISVIPDDPGIIGKEAVFFSKTYDYVFTSGGVGPTHDDVTMEGIAEGFGVKLMRHPELAERFCRRFGDSANDAVMKMAFIPEGAEIMDVGDKVFPLVIFKNIFIFPGIPEYLKNKFTAVKERFRSASFSLKKLFLTVDEPEIALALNKVVAGNPDVAIGSYPVLGNQEYKVMVTVESKLENAMNKAVEELINRMPAGKLLRIE